MQLTIKLGLILGLFFSAFCVSAQRTVFSDPDITWSFKLPKSWSFTDDGLVVKLFPKDPGIDTVMMGTITYFEPPAPEDESYYANSGLQVVSNDTDDASETNGVTTKTYRFSRCSQDFELTFYAPTESFKKAEKKWKRVMKSLQITPNPQ